MDRDLESKIVIITGGAKGIGYHIASKFLQNNAKLVILLDLDEKSGNTAALDLETKYGKGKAVFLKCDVTTDVETVSGQIVSTYEKVDVLVNNAGWLKEDYFKDTLALNTVAVVEWTKKFLEYMRKDTRGSGGTNINISSVLGIVTCPYLPFYSASKHAVIGYSKTVGHMNNYKTHGVRVIVLFPGFTRTPLSNFGQPEDSMPEEHKEYMKSCEWQDPDVVGEAAVEIFRRADSGTVWVSIGGKPVKQIPCLESLIRWPS